MGRERARTVCCGDPMFVDFAEAFFPSSPAEDAQAIANRMVTQSERAIDARLPAEELGYALPDADLAKTGGKLARSAGFEPPSLEGS